MGNDCAREDETGDTPHHTEEIYVYGHKKKDPEGSSFQKLSSVSWKAPHTNKVQKLYLL